MVALGKQSEENKGIDPSGIDWSAIIQKETFKVPPGPINVDPTKKYGGKTRGQLIRESRQKGRMYYPRSNRKDRRRTRKK
jgi:hypothetical protein